MRTIEGKECVFLLIPKITTKTFTCSCYFSPGSVCVCVCARARTQAWVNCTVLKKVVFFFFKCGNRVAHIFTIPEIV